MPVIEEQNRLSDVLKYEADNLYSRDEVTVDSGQNLAIGTVVGVVASSGKVVALDPTASDGSEAAAGVLCEDVDTVSGDKSSWIVARHAAVSEEGLVWPSGITAGQLAIAVAQLKSLGILVRKGA